MSSDETKNNLILYKQDLPLSITKYILSDYLEIEELKELQNSFEGFNIDPKRSRINTIFYVTLLGHNLDQIRTKETYIDNILRKKKHFYKNGNKWCEENFLNGVFDGEFLKWYEDGNVMTKEYFINGKKEGKQFYYNKNGTKTRELFYKDGKKLELI
jgi:hypothetical protein